MRFAAPDGVRLEGRLRVADRTRAVVLCHPHPLYGGSMLTPVILTAERAFQEAGYTTLAFNFRGVGGSEGTHGDGHAEVADVTGALDFVAEAAGGAPSLQAVAGYSFGSAVGGRVPKLGILVSIEEAYTQCPKALIRSELWNPERHVDSSELPTPGEILKAVADPELDADEYNRERAERYARGEGLY